MEADLWPYNPYNVLLAIATNIQMLLMTGLMVLGHISATG